MSFQIFALVYVCGLLTPVSLQAKSIEILFAPAKPSGCTATVEKEAKTKIETVLRFSVSVYKVRGAGTQSGGEVEFVFYDDKKGKMLRVSGPDFIFKVVDEERFKTVARKVRSDLGPLLKKAANSNNAGQLLSMGELVRLTQKLGIPLQFKLATRIRDKLFRMERMLETGKFSNARYEIQSTLIAIGWGPDCSPDRRDDLAGELTAFLMTGDVDAWESHRDELLREVPLTQAVFSRVRRRWPARISLF